METEVKVFKRELKNLLKKYNATIGFSVSDCSDTYGLYDEKIICSLRDFNNENEITLVNGWVLDKSDL